MVTEASARPRARSKSDLVLLGWSGLLAVLLLGPALLPGYVLSYDMVWVPDLALRSGFSGVATSLPRAVPSDAVVAVLDEVVPGMLVQKLVLVGSVIGAGLGMAQLVPERALPVRLLAVSLTMWNPFVIERLVIGHWPVLVGYAVAPWLVLVSRRWRHTGRFPPALLLLAPLGSLSASAGVASALLLAALCLDRARWRPVLGVVVAANLPWLVAGLLHSASATSDALGAQVFALHSEGSVPGPLAALTLGGIWNTDVVPTSRTGVLGWLTLAVVVAVAVTGLLTRRWADGRREARALLGCWVVGWGLAVLTFAMPGAVGAVAAHVPGGGLVRDGSRVLVLCMPVTVLALAEGAGVLWRRFPAQPTARIALGLGLVLAPIALLPDAAWGAAGSLRAVDYPHSWAEARPVVAADHDAHGGDVLLLPASAYRQPAWNHGVTVVDPLGRYLSPDFVASDVLVVSGVALAGEDIRFANVVSALELPSASERARGLEEVGIGTVAVERDAPGRVPRVAGQVLFDEDDLLIISLPDPDQPRAPTSWFVLIALAWGAYTGSAVVGVAMLLGEAARQRRPRRRV
jgi:hypothetical protein